MNREKNHQPKISRRSFLQKSLVAGSALAFPWVLPARVLGRGGAVAPNSKIVLGAIGIGSRGRSVLGSMLEERDVQFVAICDVQKSHRQSVKAMTDTKYGNHDCSMYRDFRELLARPDVDAILTATGDRWHALVSCLAAQAGKDVYSEKPCAMTMADCQTIEETMHRYARVYQAGTQRRSIGNFQTAIRLARSGKLGKLRTMHASVYRPRTRYDWLPAQPAPVQEELDWDMWLGPSPWRPYNHKYIIGRGWQGFDDFSAGAVLLDWGAHTVDLCQWANDADHTMPIEYEPAKDKIVARYANGVTLVLDYLDSPFGDRSPQYITRLGTCPVRFEGDEGWVETGDSGDIEVHPASLKSELRQFARSRAGTDAGSHTTNFFECIKSRAATAANPGVMRHSHIACYAAAIAWQLNRKVTFDPVKEEFVNDPEANRLRSRAAREPWRI